MTGSNSVLTSDYLCAVCGEHANEHGAIPHQFVARNSNELLPFWNKAAREKLRAVGRDRMSTEAWQICESLLNRIDQLEAAAHETPAPSSNGMSPEDRAMKGTIRAFIIAALADYELSSDGTFSAELTDAIYTFVRSKYGALSVETTVEHVAECILDDATESNVPGCVLVHGSLLQELWTALKTPPVKACACDPSGQGALPCPVHDMQSEEPCASK
jgi:hypothetical protein